MFNITIDYLSEEDELKVAIDTTAHEETPLNTILTGKDISEFHHLIKQIYVPNNVAQYAVKLVRATRPNEENAPEFVKKWVSWGAGLRAIQFLLLGGKVRAVFNGRYNVSIEDVRALAPAVLRHRVITNFYAESEQIDSDKIVEMLIDTIAAPSSGLA